MRLRVAAALVAVAGASLTVAPPAYAVDNVCLGVDSSVAPGHTGRPSAPYRDLGIAAAQEVARATSPLSGTPVRVAVLGPGVLGGAVPVHATEVRGGAAGEIEDPLGTEVAGLVAGADRPDGQPVGFAPDAEIVDVRVYRDGASDEDSARPSAPHLSDGLRWVADRADELDIKVAVVPFAVRKNGGLKHAVEIVQQAGVVLVAASGDRPEDGTELATDFATDATDPSARTEDAGPVLFPAGYPGVVAVNSSGDPEGAFANVLKNSRTVVAAPSYDAVSYGLNGGTCLVQPTSTAAAAGEVAGVLALLWRRHPDDGPRQVVARLVNTANGTTDDPTPLTGAGVVQPYEALTRPLAPAADGTVERTVVRDAPQARAPVPEPEPDVLADLRDDAVWWGLIGGGLLVIALLLRPVLARRRR
ncbi:S8/S53 family peptidase [Nocardioides sp. YIM 152315]|uniref:S8/S53 family peptidase n=1 Tax=Nocardioides sp. YIM 152315 TaxID=3031760 RepID=UPI0023DB6E0C|nr:S8/S53 family peptidase [Nocardioides sp. YIM 152315]MDF1605245.1 S8/S53 family peptidase [Nocardioides sp. YIM 152315]